MTELLIPSRFCGPPASGNGGWAAGALAGMIPGAGAVQVALRQPPPLDVPMALSEVDGWLTALDSAGATVLGARPTEAEPTPVPPVPLHDARAATASYPGLDGHPFPTCFVCGPDRAPGDGLRIFPGPVAEGRAAATWTPAEDVDLATVWAALDCAGAWSADLAERPMVLAAMTCRILRMPRPGQEHVVVGAVLRSEGRKRFTATSLYDAADRLVGTAEHLWITVETSAFS